jgi:hypothetical protein
VVCDADPDRDPSRFIPTPFLQPLRHEIAETD